MLPSELNQKYEMRGTLGAGAMGVVYEAIDRFLGRPVAIKVVKRQTGRDAEGVESDERFRREAQAAGRFTHPNIVLVYDYGENAEQAWIVMEKVEGGSLKDRIDSHERFPLPEIVRIMDEILRGLAYAHAHGVAAHRDIKPANIMLTRDGTVKIADFGIARTEGSHLTQIGTLIGTPAYMAPEQFRAEPVDLRTDIWAAGVVLYQLLTDEKPFDGKNPATVMQRVLNTEPQPPSQHSVTTPRAFDGVIARALAKRPEDRFPTALAFAEGIRAAAAATSQVPPGPTPSYPGSDATVVATGMQGGLPPLPGMGPPSGQDSGAYRPGGAMPAPPKPPVPAPTAGGGGRMAVLAGAAAVALVAAGGAAWFFWPNQNNTVVTQAPPPPPTPEPPRPPVQEPPRPPVQEPPRPPIQEPPRPPVQDPPRPLVPEPPRPPVQEPPRPPVQDPPRPRIDPDTPVTPARPPVQSSVGPTALDLRAAGQVAAQAPCSLLSWSATDQSLTVGGVIRRSAVAALGRSLASRGVPDSAMSLQLQPFDGPYCDALELFRPVLGPFGAPPTAAVLGTLPLANGERIRIDIQMPAWPGFLYVGYLDSHGGIAHLVQARSMQPSERIVVGQTDEYTVGPPFGTDMVVVVASERPLFGQERLSDSTQEFLPVLARALAAQMQARTRIAMRPMVLETVERR